MSIGARGIHGDGLGVVLMMMMQNGVCRRPPNLASWGIFLAAVFLAEEGGMELES